MLRSVIVAAQFLTRVPVSLQAAQPEDLARAAGWFPLIGALVGAAVAGVIAGAAPLLGVDAAIVAGLVFGTLLTGAFHEDGLADACDGLGGGVTRERALAIMRDSRIGSYGSVSLVLLYAARFALLRTLTVPSLLLALPVASALGRASSVLLMAWLPNARRDGLANDIGRTLARSTVTIGLVTPLILGIVLCGIAALPGIITALLVTGVSGIYLRHRLGGITGDCLGAVNVVVEIAALAAAVAWMRARGTLEVLQWP